MTIDGDPQTGWSVAGRQGERHVAVFVPASPLTGAALQLTMTFGRHYASSLGKFRISVTTDTGAVAHELSQETEELLLLPDKQLNDTQRGSLREAFLLSAPELAKATARIRELRGRPVYPTTLVMQERPPHHPRPTFLHERGEFLRPAERVKPGVPESLRTRHSRAGGNPDWARPTSRSLADASGYDTRLDLARWLVSPENPLTARVTVNRAWAAFFGHGLVRTTEDFGLQGEPPSHPELLDWLAVELVEQGWSLKRMHRLIVTSAAYRQSSTTTPELLARDPTIGC
jgi:hypothetical protein